MTPETLQWLLAVLAIASFGYSVYLHAGHAPYVYAGIVFIALLFASVMVQW